MTEEFPSAQSRANKRVTKGIVLMILIIGGCLGAALMSLYFVAFPPYGRTTTATLYEGTTTQTSFSYATTETTTLRTWRTITEVEFGDSENAVEIQLDYEFIGNATMIFNVTEIFRYLAEYQEYRWDTTGIEVELPKDQFIHIRSDEIRLNIRIRADNIDQILEALRRSGIG